MIKKNKIILFLGLLFFASNFTSAQEATVNTNLNITSPAAGEILTNPQNINLEVKIFNGSADKVNFKIFQQEEIENLEANIGGDNIWNKTLNVYNYKQGKYSISAEATLKNNQIITSPIQAFEIIINRPLDINLVAPTSSIMSGKKLFQIKSSIPTENIYLLLTNGLIYKNLGSLYYNQSADLWELDYDTTALEDGAYDIVIEAYAENKYDQVRKKITIENNNQISQEELPIECAVAGALDQKTCQKFLFTWHNVNCLEESNKACDAVKENPNFPDECRLENITESIECQKLLVTLYGPVECQSLSSLKKCQETLWDKYVQPKCQEKQINEMTACEDYLIKQYQGTFSCQTLDEVTCQRVVKERHLPFLISSLEELSNLEENLKDFSEIINSQVKIIPSIIKILLDNNDELLYSPPMILAIDGDGDGLPDVTETRLGSDPKRHDSDRDGFNDFREIMDSLSNLQELGIELSPLDQIIFEDTKLEQPATNGLDSLLLRVEKVINKNSSLVFSGTSFPNSFVTLFIYSDVPLVFDVKTDDNGKFDSAIPKVLPDKHYRAYAAVINDQGKILAKSDAYNFSVKNGQVIETNSLLEKIIKKNNSNFKIFYLVISFFIVLILSLITKKGLFPLLLKKK